MDGIADYRFLGSLGEGAHGRFYLATPPPRLGLTAEHVAVKVLVGHSDEDTVRRTTRELRAFASARSPYLVDLYDAGRQEHAFFYAMAYFPEGSLAAPAKALTRPEVLRAVEHAALAAAALHEVGIVHRSIKPGNVLLHPGGAKLSDLGLAQDLNPGQTVTGLGPIGEVEYLEPAVLLGERGTQSSDIWSLAVTLHRALTGVGVYGELPDNDPLMAVRTVLSNKPRLDPGLHPDDAALLAGCLSPVPDERPATAAELANQLARLQLI